MKVKEVMMMTPYACHPETNLGAATELMWKGNCGFLPVLESSGRIKGVITDRDICVALGTRNTPAGSVTVGDVMHGKLFTCMPEDDVHVGLQVMREGHVRRLPVINAGGKLVGVLSLHDIVLKAQPTHAGQEPELSADEVMRTYRAIMQKELPMAAKKAAG
jgi:CBS domain-containing protein